MSFNTIVVERTQLKTSAITYFSPKQIFNFVQFVLVDYSDKTHFGLDL